MLKDYFSMNYTFRSNSSSW